MNWPAAGTALEGAGAWLEDPGAWLEDALLVDGTVDGVVELLGALAAGALLREAAVRDDDRAGPVAAGDAAAGEETGAVEDGIGPAGVDAEATAEAVPAVGAPDEMSCAARVSETP